MCWGWLNQFGVVVVAMVRCVRLVVGFGNLLLRQIVYYRIAIEVYKNFGLGFQRTCQLTSVDGNLVLRWIYDMERQWWNGSEHRKEHLAHLEAEKNFRN